MKDITSWFVRNGILIALIVAGCIGLGIWEWQAFLTLAKSLLMAGIAIFAAILFGNMAVFLYTKISFTTDHPLTLGDIFRGICLIIAVCITMFVWFNSKSMMPN